MKEIPYKWLLITDQFVSSVITKKSRDIRKLVAKTRKKSGIAIGDVSFLCDSMLNKKYTKEIHNDPSLNPKVRNYMFDECIHAIRNYEDSLRYDEKLHDQCIKDGGFPISFSEVDHELKLSGEKYRDWYEVIAHYEEESQDEYFTYCRDEIPDELEREDNEDEYEYRIDKCMEKFSNSDQEALERALDHTIREYVEDIAMKVDRINTRQSNPEFCLIPTAETPHKLAVIVGLGNFNHDFSYEKGSYPYDFYNQWFDVKTKNYYSETRKPSKKRLDQFVKDQWREVFWYAAEINKKDPEEFFFAEFNRLR